MSTPPLLPTGDAEPGSPPENLFEIAQLRKVYREALRDPDAPQRARELALDELAAARRILARWSMIAEGGLSAAKARLRAEQVAAESAPALAFDHEVLTAQLGSQAPLFWEIARATHAVDEIRDFIMHQALAERTSRGLQRDAHARLLGVAKQEEAALASQVTALEQAHPTLVRAQALVRLAEGLSQEGHIAPTKSVVEHLERIGQNMLLGKPMLLHGPTGTGKTSLARFAAHHFTGKRAEMVYCSPQTRESSVWGKTGIRPAKQGGGSIETVDIYGPLAKAMDEGRVGVFAEFRAPQEDQMVFLKGIFNAKVGDTVNVVGNGQVRIQSGFQMIFTANLKSPKNTEQSEMPTHIVREFEQNNLKIDHVPPHEAYQIMLVRRLDEDGTALLSWHDLHVTLPKLCEAMAEIQHAYTETTRTETAQLVKELPAAGQAPGLKKLVLTQGTVEAMLSAWKLERSKDPALVLAAYLDQRLAIGLKFVHGYPDADRRLAAKILASKGFLRTLTPQQLNLPADVFEFDATRSLRDEAALAQLLTASGKVARRTLLDLADLDPFGIRSTDVAKAAQALLPAGAGGKETPEAPSLAAIKVRYQSFLRETFTMWYSSDPTKAQVEQHPSLQDPRRQPYAQLATDVAPTEFGHYTVHPEVQALSPEQLATKKLVVVELDPVWNGKTIHQVAEHVMATYGQTHLIPDLAIWQRILEGKYDVQTPALKDGNWHFCFGSLLRRAGGLWEVPFACWFGAAWRRYASRLGRSWGADVRVVLLER